jgi:hypothetical protein
LKNATRDHRVASYDLEFHSVFAAPLQHYRKSFIGHQACLKLYYRDGIYRRPEYDRSSFHYARKYEHAWNDRISRKMAGQTRVLGIDIVSFGMPHGDWLRWRMRRLFKRERKVPATTCRGSAGRTFKLDHVTFWITDIDGGSIAVGTIAVLGFTRNNAVLDEVRNNRKLIERLYTQAQVVHVPSFCARCSTAFPAELAVYGNQIDHGLACSQLDESDVLPGTLDDAAQYVAVKLCHTGRILHPQHDVIEAKDVDHEQP